VKYRILEELKNNISQFVSGEALSEVLKVSRTAVWKNIKELEREGYVIEASSKKGYRLISVPDVLNASEVGSGLLTRFIGRNVQCFDVIDSTNNYAKRIAAEGCDEGTVVIADSQNSGRGRLGRTWNAPGKTGIWMSVVLRPDLPPESVQLITLGASVAVVSAIRKTLGVQAGIKWPNDLVLDGKKVCGILTEMNSEMERVNFLVLGIGVNVNQLREDFPGDLIDTATSLKAYLMDKGVDTPDLKRSELIKSILFELEQIYDSINSNRTEEIIEEWKRYSVTMGREVRVVSRSQEYSGVASDVTADGRLVIKCSDGTMREVLSGEVSVRGILGYA